MNKKRYQDITIYISGKFKRNMTSYEILKKEEAHLGLVAGVLGDGLGALGDGVLGELTGEKETNGSLHLTGGEGVLLVVASKTSGLGGDALEHVAREGVHDGHGLGADAGILVNLLQNPVDVDPVGLLPPSLALLGSALLANAGTLSSLVATLLGNLGLLSTSSSPRHVRRVGSLGDVVSRGSLRHVRRVGGLGTGSRTLVSASGGLSGLVLGFVGSHLDEVGNLRGVSRLKSKERMLMVAKLI